MTNPVIWRLIQKLANPRLNKQAVDDLIQHGSDAVEPLCGALGDKRWVVRWSAATALGGIGDSVTLPRKLLAETRLTPQQRLKGLEALKDVHYRDSMRVLRYSLLNIRDYCRARQQDPDTAVREGAQAVLALLDSSSLLRASQRAGSKEPEELLRVAAPLASEVASGEMLRASEERHAPAPQSQKRRGLLARWLER